MSIAIGLALFVMILGAIIYWIAANPKLAEMGRIAFFVGLFFVVSGAGAALSLVVK